MEKQICARCGEESDNKLPLCISCKKSLAGFNALVEYLNSFTGSKEDLLWIIGSELSNRESSIINNVRLENDSANGIILMVPIGGRLKLRYQHIKNTIDEISKLRRALGIARQYYGIT